VSRAPQRRRARAAAGPARRAPRAAARAPEPADPRDHAPAAAARRGRPAAPKHRRPGRRGAALRARAHPRGPGAAARARVPPAAAPRTDKPTAGAMQPPSYAGAPIAPAGPAIAFFHAARYGQELPVSARDRDNLWVFAEHFGLLYERAVLVERMERQRTALRQ